MSPSRASIICLASSQNYQSYQQNGLNDKKPRGGKRSTENLYHGINREELLSKWLISPKKMSKTKDKFPRELESIKSNWMDTYSRMKKC